MSRIYRSRRGPRRRTRSMRRRRNFTGSYRRGGKAWRGLRAGYNRIGGFYGRFNKRPGAQELKYKDIVGVQLLPVPPFGVRLTTDPAQPLDIAVGPGADQRIGRQLILKSLHIRGTIRLEANNAPSNATDSVRILIVWDRQANGDSVQTNEFLQESFIGGAIVNNDIDAFKNMENSDRFKFLYDKIHNLSYKAGGLPDGGTVPVGMAVEKRVNIFRKVHIPITYDDVTQAMGGMAKIKSNHISIWAFSRHGHINMSVGIRIRFVG